MAYTRAKYAYLLGIILSLSFAPILSMEPSSLEDELKEERDARIKEWHDRKGQELEELILAHARVTNAQALEGLAEAQKYIDQEEVTTSSEEESDHETVMPASTIELETEDPQEPANTGELELEELKKAASSVDLGQFLENEEPFAESTPGQLEVMHSESEEEIQEEEPAPGPEITQQQEDFALQENTVPQEQEEEIPTPAPQPLNEEFLAQVLRNIKEYKTSVLTGGSLALIQYLKESSFLSTTIPIRSPKVRDVVFKHFLPTLRDALAAHLIQLVVPLLPYFHDKGMRSFSSVNYLASFATSKVIGLMVIHLAKLAQKTHQGKNLLVRYKKLPQKTQQTIETVAPWLDFIRNMLMAQSMAGFFESPGAA